MVKEIDKEALREQLSPPDFSGVRKLSQKGYQRIEPVAMNMWNPYEIATKTRCPRAAIVYNRFHVEQGFKRVIDAVRREEYSKVNRAATEKRN